MKWVWWLVLLIVVLGVILGWLTIRTYLPVNPVVPYFPGSTERLGGVHWNLGEFQPVYLYSFTNKGDYFIKVAYRDSGQNVKLMDVLVGKSGADGIPLSGVIIADGSTVNIADIGNYGKYFKIGSRIHITYLWNVLKRTGNLFDIVEPNAENIKSICDSSKMICYSISLLQVNPDAFWNFPVTGDFPSNLTFPVYKLSNKLLSQ